MIEPPGAFAAEVFATSTETPPASRGSARKKLSTFFDYSLSLCLIHPTAPLLILIKYHLIPPAPWDSATGVALSLGKSTPIGGVLSSGAA